MHENLVLPWTWQDTDQQLRELAVKGLAGAQAEVESARKEVESARAAVHFAENCWRQAISSNDGEQASKWEQKVQEAKQKVQEAKQEVQEAEQKVREAKQEVEKAKQEVQEAKQEVQEAGALFAVMRCPLLCFCVGQIGVRRHQGGSFVWLSFGGPGFLPVLAYPGSGLPYLLDQLIP